MMNCCNNNYSAANCCSNVSGCGNDSGFSCIINLIIILIVLQFLTQIICDVC